jgi:hypothetical protein
MSEFDVLDALADRAAKAEGVSRLEAREAVETATDVLMWRLDCRAAPRGRVLRLARLMINPRKHRRSRRVAAEVTEIALEGDCGHPVPSVAVTCSKCQETVEIYGREENSIIRGCATLADECCEWNFYVHAEACA